MRHPIEPLNDFAPCGGFDKLDRKVSFGMLFLERIARQKIEEAIERGEFDNLPGQGQPLDLSEDPFVRPDQRLAHKILRNANIAPPEVSLRRELAELKNQYQQARSETERSELRREIKLMALRINTMFRHACNQVTEY